MIWMEVVDDTGYQSTSSNYFHGKDDIKTPLGLIAYPWPRMKFGHRSPKKLKDAFNESVQLVKSSS
jgi:hypothetical protein